MIYLFLLNLFECNFVFIRILNYFSYLRIIKIKLTTTIIIIIYNLF